MATWKKILVSGLDLASSDVTSNHIGVSDGTNSTDITLGNNITFSGGGDVSVTESGGTVTISATAGEANQNAFSNLTVDSGTNPAADTTTDTLVLAGETNVITTTGTDPDTVTISIDAGGISTAKLAADAVTNAKLADDAVATANILDDNVTLAKLEHIGSLTVIGNVLGNENTPAEIGIDTDLSAVSNTHNTVASAKAIKDYVDNQNTAADLDFSADTGGNLSIDLDSEVLSIIGTANEIETAGSGNQIQIGLPDDVTIGNDLVVTGDLTVNGDTTTVNTANLLVEDTFIQMNSGGSTNVDAGIVFTGAANKVFGWDQSAGRFAVAYEGGDASVSGGFDTDPAKDFQTYVATVHSGAGTPAGTDDLAIAAFEQIGNIFVDTNSSNNDIYIYS